MRKHLAIELQYECDRLGIRVSKSVSLVGTILDFIKNDGIGHEPCMVGSSKDVRHAACRMGINSENRTIEDLRGLMEGRQGRQVERSDPLADPTLPRMQT